MTSLIDIDKHSPSLDPISSWKDKDNIEGEWTFLREHRGRRPLLCINRRCHRDDEENNTEGIIFTLDFLGENVSGQQVL